MGVQVLNRLLERVNKLLTASAVLFLVVTVVIVVCNVLSRYLLRVSLTWSAELARFSIIWSALLAASVLVNRRQHLTVDLLQRKLRGRSRMVADIVIGVGSMTFFLIALISGCKLVVRTSGQVASSIETLPMNLVYLIVPLSALFMLLGSCAELLKVVHKEDSTD